jgi:glycosyltransferase involved in cell wall biosynthesis
VRIALVTDTYIPQVNGVTTVVHRIAQVLAGAGHRVGIVAPRYPRHADGGREGSAEILRIPSIPFPPYPAIRLSLPFRRRVTGFLDTCDPHVIHVATEGPLGVLGRWYARRRDVPLVTSFHTDFPRYARAYGVGVLESAAWRWLIGFHAAARVVQTPGEAIRAVLADRGLTQVTVWGRGVDASYFRPDRRDIAWRRALGAAGRRPIVLHVGRLAAEKNLDVLIAAFATAHRALGDEAVFVIAGDGPRARRVRRALPWARHLGVLDRSRLAALYASADLCVLPSATETCGLVALEAMASGLPVIAADAGGLRESVAHGRTGFLCAAHDPRRFADAVVLLARDAELRRGLSGGARRAAVERDVAIEDQHLLSQYASLTRAPGQVGVPCAA